MTMRSMTGFGQGAEESRAFRIAVVLRAVNHRYLDLALRLRESYRALEPALRESLTARLFRGRVEATVEIEPLGKPEVEVEVDLAMAAAVRSAADDLAARGIIGEDAGPSFGDLMRLGDAVRVVPRPPPWEAADEEAFGAALAAALDQLIEARDLEGAQLAAVLSSRLDELEGAVEALHEAAASWPAAAAAALRERIDALLADGPAPDPERLAQEVALLVDKSDVREELDRLRSHLVHFRTVMAEDGAIGKRLDFLAQEIFRELNTVGAKCRDAAMTRLVLDGKASCEQLREQVQNVE